MVHNMGSHFEAIIELLYDCLNDLGNWSYSVTNKYASALVKIGETKLVVTSDGASLNIESGGIWEWPTVQFTIGLSDPSSFEIIRNQIINIITNLSN